MLQIFTRINADWIDVKNECRNTVNKGVLIRMLLLILNGSF